MRRLRWTLLLCASLVVAGCSSVSPSDGGAASGSPGGPADSPPGASSTGAGSAGARPPGPSSPAPIDSDGLQLLGPVPSSLLSLTGPYEPAGPYLARTLPQLLDRYRAAAGGRLACPTAGCWHDADVPDGTVLLGVRPAGVACYLVRSITTAEQGGGLRVDLQLAYRCPPGHGSSARMPAMLIGLPADAASGPVTVRASLKPGTPFSTIGTARIAG